MVAKTEKLGFSQKRTVCLHRCASDRPCSRRGWGVGAFELPGSDTNRTYNLDGLGNWKTSTYTPVGGSQTTDQRNHDYVNEITQRTVGAGSQVVFQYDGTAGASNGNLKNDGTLIYAYDSFNRIIQINRVSDDLVIATYVYDAMNRRVRITISNGGLTGNVPNGTTDYIWLGSQVMEERSSSNSPIRQYVWGTYIDELMQLTILTTLGPQSLPPGAYYLLQDLLYRAVALTNSSGGVVEAYDTDAYGNTLIFTAPDSSSNWWSDSAVQSSYGANEIIYCGYRLDPETNLYYVRARTYSPVAGRWIQRDPIGYAGGINLYEYVGGHAGYSLDPFGNWEVDAGVYAAASGSVDFMSGEISLGGWLWAGIGFQFGWRWWGWSFYTQGTLLHRRFGFLDWITPGKCACRSRGNWWSTGPGFFATLSPGQNNGIKFGPLELGVLLLVQPGGERATVEGVLIWNAVKDLPAGWAITKVLHFLHIHAAVDIIGSFSFEICPRRGGGITADKAVGSISLALHLGHAPGNIGR
jgi:RHS repeat-associated protein